VDNREAVAIKVSHGGEEGSRCAEREIKADSVLNERCGEEWFARVRERVVRVLDHFENEGRTWLVYPRLEEDMLKAIRKNGGYGRVGLGELQRLTRGVLEGLCALHEVGLVHGDMKPENVMVDACGEVFIIDLGSTHEANTETGNVVSTLHYRAPEVLIRAPHDQAADMWSVGALLVELFMGQPVFAGESELEMFELLEEWVNPMPQSLVFAPTSREYRGAFDEKGGFLGQAEVCGRLGWEVCEGGHRHREQWGSRSLSSVISGGVELKEGGDNKRGGELGESCELCELEKLWEFTDLVMKLLVMDPFGRLTARDALEHAFVVEA
jgi:serine/threonine protein kinase